jgi:hypothetical protein
MAKIDERGHWQNKRGELVHPDMVPVDKKLEDEVVEELLEKAMVAHGQLEEFKLEAFAQCYDYVDLLRQEYGMDRMAGSSQGSVTLKNFNGTKEVQIQVAKLIQFDQKLSLAKEKIDEYLTEKTQDVDPEIQTLITRVFEVKNGKVDAKQIFGLKNYPIKHPKWLEAMTMIDDATEIAGTKAYIRFKKRIDGKVDGALQTVILDLAALPITEADIDGVRKKAQGDV